MKTAALAGAVVAAPFVAVWLYAWQLDLTRRYYDRFWDWEAAPLPYRAP